jgi:hypothetical protein
MTKLAGRTYSLSSAEVNDTDGIVTATATLTTESTLTTGDFDGAVIGGVGGDTLSPPRAVTFTYSDTAGAFTTDPAVVTGWRGGNLVTDEVAPTADGGDETVRGAQLFDRVETVVIPGQQLTTGSISIGVGDIGCPGGSHFVGLRTHASGPVTIGFNDSGTMVDTLPGATLKEDVRFQRVATENLSVGITLYH